MFDAEDRDPDAQDSGRDDLRPHSDSGPARGSDEDETGYGDLRGDAASEVDDLSEDRDLRSCPRVEREGKTLPSLGGYLLLRELGAGAMGRVFVAIAQDSSELVAIKLLTLGASTDSDAAVERFWREAHHAQRLKSPHLVDVIAVAKRPLHHIVMEYVRGVDAEKWARSRSGSDRSGAPEDEALDVCIAATRGLVVAHADGVLHRDVKPANILVPLSERGEPLPRKAKLADLGLARLESGGDAVTMRATPVGTPGYMPPEQHRGDVGKPADVFAMGATLYKLLTGVAPKDCVTDANRAARDPVWLRQRRADVTEPTKQLVERCLESSPALRFVDASQLLEAMTHVRSDTQRASRSASDAAAALACFSPPPALSDDVGSRKSGSPGASEAPPPVPPVASPPVARSSAQEARRWAFLVLALVATLIGLWQSGVLRVSDPRGGPALRVASTPPGARVLVDGTPRGITPVEVWDLDDGTYSVRLELEYYEPSTELHRIDRTAPTRIIHEFRRAHGALDIEGGSAGAAARLLRRGLPPRDYLLRLDATGALSAEAIECGTYTLYVDRPGHEAFVTIVEILDGARSTVGISGASQQGRIDLTGLGEGVTAWLDGRPYSGVVEMPTGQYSVELRRGGHTSVLESVRVVAGEIVRVDAPEWTTAKDTSVSPDALAGVLIVHRSRGELGDATMLVDSLLAALEVQQPAPITRSSRELGGDAGGDAELERALAEIGSRLGRRLVVFLDVKAESVDPVDAAGIRLQRVRSTIRGTLVDASTGDTLASVEAPSETASGHDAAQAARTSIETGGARVLKRLAQTVRVHTAK